MNAARRRLLACVPAALAPAAAGAFRFEPATAEVAAEYGSACTATGVHDALRTEIGRATGGPPLPPEAEARLRLLSRCPLCGCLAGLPPEPATTSPG
jgi:hypothetical protein